MVEVLMADLRVGDADREAVAAALQEHYAQGRLSHEEFTERLDAALSARTQRDLDALTSDLPHVRIPSAPLPTASVNPGAGRSGGGRAGGAFTSLRIVVAVALAVALWCVAMVHTWHFTFFGVAGKWPVLAVGLLVLRWIMRHVFGLRRRGSRPLRRW
jgi:hypothetical protein